VFSRSQRRLALLLAALVLVIVGSAVLYMLGMRHLEGQPRSFADSLEWAAETLTTTGYGADARWRHPLMLLFVIALQFVGVFLVFLVVPIYLIPFLEERFQTRLPHTAPDLRDHVVIFRYGPAVATLLTHLNAAGIPTVVIEEDEATARRVAERGVRVVHRSLDETSLADVALPRARALVANGSDSEDAVIVLAARQLGFQGLILALVEEPVHRRPILLAGATVAFTPRHILGAALAARASERIEPRVSGIQQLGRSLRVSEIRIRAQSPVANRTLAEADIGAQTGATVIGQWVGGELIAPPTGSMVLVPNGLLVVLSSEQSLARLEALVKGAARQHRRGPFVVAGFGEVGGKVAELLRVAGEEVWVIDRCQRDGVDMTGDMLDPEALARTPIPNAQAVILALDSDSATLFATTILKDFAPDVPVIARVNQAENLERIYRAGADFALSISQVSAQMLARRLLGEEAVEVDAQLTVMKVPVEPLLGRHPSDLHVRERTGCSIVAVERDDEAILEFPADFRFEAGDTVFVSGTADGVRRFQERLG
jgi:Trk K+ transport system NAD-binding subunit